MYDERKALTACIIDDDQIYVFGFKKTLLKTGLHTQPIDFHNGQDALDFFCDPYNINRLPDIIFLDINMPVMDGWDFIAAFAEIKPRLEKDITVYMVSSSINPVDVLRAKNISAITDYMIKPIDAELLSKLMQRNAA